MVKMSLIGDVLIDGIKQLSSLRKINSNWTGYKVLTWDFQKHYGWVEAYPLHNYKPV